MPKLFKKILVANRSEIAVRVIRACRQLGISTVSIYSSADKDAVHTIMGDEAYEIGPPPPLESYLNIEKIIGVAKESGAEAIHPGYGFLAENPAFAQACEESGIVFIGPTAAAMRLMGNKVESRKAMIEAGVPVTPGMQGSTTDMGIFTATAQKVGFPVLVKAAAGGGGKGMRIVQSSEELPDAVAGAMREAKSAFGDDTVYLEKYIVNPRHIEFQVLADTQGKVVHLFERECSIQRRHQKIVEETPSVAVTPELRTQMGEAAVAVAIAAGYVNAGTVEFLLAPDSHFYFLEMNTRVQVEHPVTEEVVGVDLVAEQIRIAAGFPMSAHFDKPVQRGHAIECRIYAEDAGNNFMPSAGRILYYREPSGPGIRVDSGVMLNSQVGIDYDPIMAKLIAWGPDRDTARARMIKALSEYKILGLRHSIKYLSDIIAHPKFAAGETYTGFIPEHFADWDNGNDSRLEAALAAAAVHEASRVKMNGGVSQNEKPAIEPWQTLGNWRIGEKIA